MTTTIESIKKELLVEASQETAFNVFTSKMGAWWPKTHHVGSCPMIELILESKPNGRWYSTHEDGSEVNVGHILVWDPYGRLVLNWQINGDFKYDAALTTEVEVRFIAEGPKRTKVIMEHRDLDKLGGGKAIGSMDEGWGMIMNLYKDLADQQP
ncbi:SRPBCC family protein [Mucilaginibacter sp. AW1-3]